MAEDADPQTLDFLFRFNTRNYPISVHKVLELPGEFKNIEDTAVFIFDEPAKQADHVEKILPDGKMVKRESVSTVEQQTGKLSPSKVNDIYIYCLYYTIHHKRPCYAIVVTDYDYGKDYEDYEVDGFSFRIYFRTFNREKIYEMLNRLKRKDYNNEELSNEDYFRLICCLIFAKKEFAKDIIEEIVKLFATIEKISYNHQINLHLALKMMIKFRFGDDLNKKEELLIMITKSVHESQYEKINGYEVEQKSLEELKKDFAQQKIELETKLENIKNKNIQQENELKNIKNKNIQQENEIKKLKKTLKNNGIKI